MGSVGERKMMKSNLSCPLYSSKLHDSNPGGWDACFVIDSLILTWDQKLIASPHSQLACNLIFFV